MTENLLSDSEEYNPSISNDELLGRIENNYSKEVEANNSLPHSFKEGEGVLFTPDTNDNHADVDTVAKGGPGSGCNPSVGTCGRPATGMKTRYPNAFTFNEKDPIKTIVNRDGKPVDKFVITPDGNFVPVARDEAHGVALGDFINYDITTRVIQDTNRKLAVIRLGSVDKTTLNDAIMGDKGAMNRVIAKQREIAEKLYGKHKGWTVVLASGGTWRFHDNNLPNKLDNAEDLPENMEGLVNKEFIYKT